MKQKESTWKIFRFTLTQRIKTGGYLPAVIAGAVLCFAVPFLIMVGMEKFGGEESEKTNPVTSVYVAEAPSQEDAGTETSEDMQGSAGEESLGGLQGLAGKAEIDYNSLNSLGREGYTDINYKVCGSFEEAAQAADGQENAVILAVENGGASAELKLVLPRNSSLTKEDLEGLEAFLKEAYSYIQIQRSGLEPEQLMQLTAPVEISSHRSARAEQDDMDKVREILAYVLPYLNIMVLYFLVLFYGQGVSTSVLMEKTSKLMDTMLLSVRPGSMVLGKVLAQALAGALQIFAWLAGLTGGLLAGFLTVKAINPETQMLLVKFLESLNGISGIFTGPAVLAALLQLAGGFLLYCALAAIGGAVAGKQEELSSTNMLFVLVLVGSFLLSLSCGGLGSMAGSSAWLNWMPFSAVLLVPSRVLLGQITVWEAFGSLAVVLAAFVVIALFAGKLYQCMAMYKGKTPKPKELLRLLRG
ncbi:MAG: ABC transporter permease [Lachnospiraceae bacterium]|nr:ABC transporter permease [Lachnospiraceae bacterium]